MKANQNHRLIHRYGFATPESVIVICTMAYFLQIILSLASVSVFNDELRIKTAKLVYFKNFWCNPDREQAQSLK